MNNMSDDSDSELTINDIRVTIHLHVMTISPLCIFVGSDKLRIRDK